MRFKILQYNILNGMCTEKRPYSIDEKRKRHLLKVVEREKPDILIMCEASCWPFVKKENPEDYVKAMENMCQKDCISDGSFRWAPVIITRFDFESKNMSEYFRSFIRSTIKIGSKTITLDAVHPSPELSEKERNEFFSKVMKSGKPHIVAGDFNSLSPEDDYDLHRLTRGYASFMGEEVGKAKVQDIITANAIMPLIKEGMIDTHLVMAKGDFTVPTDWRSKNKDSAVRLDYIFCSEEFKIIESGVIKDHITNKASDHYPIYAILEI